MNICANCKHVLPKKDNTYGGWWECGHPRRKKQPHTHPITGRMYYWKNSDTQTDSPHPCCIEYNAVGKCDEFEAGPAPNEGAN